MVERVYGLGGTSVGDYWLGDCLGHGSCTAVYRASTGAAQCALKLVDGRLSENGALSERLGRERTILDAIGHAGILPINDAIRQDFAVGTSCIKPAFRDDDGTGRRTVMCRHGIEQFLDRGDRGLFVG